MLYYVTFKVQARTGSTLEGGWGMRSDVITHSTEAGKPGSPTELERTYRNESCLSISWSRPGEQNGIIIKYKVMLIIGMSHQPLYYCYYYGGNMGSVR